MASNLEFWRDESLLLTAIVCNPPGVDGRGFRLLTEVCEMPRRERLICARCQREEPGEEKLLTVMHGHDVELDR